MWIAVLLILLGWGMDVIAFNSKGKFTAVVFIIIALGLSAIGLGFVPTTNPIQMPQITIVSTSGTTVIPQYNITQSPTATTNQFAIAAAYMNVFIQVGLVILIIGALFFEQKQKKRKQANS